MSSNDSDHGRAPYDEDEDIDHLDQAMEDNHERDDNLDTSSYMSSSGDSDDSEWHIMPLTTTGKKIDGKYVTTRLNPPQIPDWVHLPATDEPGFIHTIAMLPKVRPYFRKRIPLPTRLLPGYKPTHTKQETDSRRHHVAVYYLKARGLKYG